MLIEVSWKDCSETKQTLLQDSLKRPILLFNAMTLLFGRREIDERPWRRRIWKTEIEEKCPSELSGDQQAGKHVQQAWSSVGRRRGSQQWPLRSGHTLRAPVRECVKPQNWECRWNTRIVQTKGSRRRKVWVCWWISPTATPGYVVYCDTSSRIWLIFLNTIWVF